MSIQLKGNDNSSFSDDVTVAGAVECVGVFNLKNESSSAQVLGSARGASSSNDIYFRGTDQSGVTTWGIESNDGAASFAGNTTYGPSPVINGRQNYLTIGPGPFGVGSGTDYCLAYYDSGNTLKYGLKIDGSAGFCGSGASGNAYFNIFNQADTNIFLYTTANIKLRMGVSSGTGAPGAGPAITAAGDTTWSSFSDERMKTNLKPITDGLNKVSTLRSVTGRYTWDEETADRSFLIAQDVEKVLPQAVTVDEEGHNLRYTEVIPLLVSALHDAKDRIEALEAEVQSLKGGQS